MSSQVDIFGSKVVSLLSLTFLSLFRSCKDLNSHLFISFFLTLTFRCPSRRERRRDTYLGRQNGRTRRLHRALQHRECFSAGVRDTGTCGWWDAEVETGRKKEEGDDRLALIQWLKVDIFSFQNVGSCAHPTSVHNYISTHTCAQ